MCKAYTYILQDIFVFCSRQAIALKDVNKFTAKDRPEQGIISLELSLLKKAPADTVFRE